MEVIVSHGGTGFDGLAAMVACAKLHPQAAMVLVGGQSPGVRRFIAEHELYRAEQLKQNNISTTVTYWDSKEPCFCICQAR